MARWVTRIVLAHAQRAEEYRALQAGGIWDPLPARHPSDLTIGILGLGEVGRAIGVMLAGLGHPVLGWRSSPTAVPGLEVFVGDDGLLSVVSQSDVLVNVLPSTPGTRHLLTAGLLARLPADAAFVNVGRGDVVADADLLDALDAGHPSIAHLDVFSEEPLPADSPFWSHPAVRLTPHVSGPTSIPTALPGLVDNLHRIVDGEDPSWVVDAATGY